MAEDPDGSFDVSVPTRDITALNSAFASGGYASTEIEEIIGRRVTSTSSASPCRTVSTSARWAATSPRQTPS